MCVGVYVMCVYVCFYLSVHLEKVKQKSIIHWKAEGKEGRKKTVIKLTEMAAIATTPGARADRTRNSRTLIDARKSGVWGRGKGGTSIA